MEKFLLYLVIAQAALLVIILIIWAGYSFLKKKVGDCEVQWIDGYLQVEEPEYNGDFEALLKFGIPIKSAGRQQCLMIDMNGRIHPEGDKYMNIDNDVHIFRSDNKRRDRYWESSLIKQGDTMILKGEVIIKSMDKPIKDVMAELGCIDIDIYYKYYCRSPLAYERKVIRLELGRFQGITPIDIISKYATTDKGQKALPIRTPLLVPGDDLYFVFERYVKPHLKDGDVLAVCESALAIMEGRAYYCEDIKPGFLATHLNRFFKMDSSLSSVYSLEMGVREVGAAKILFSAMMGVLGKLVGRAGDFYLFAGRAVATIDDCTGTLPPFDKYVVMGPANPGKTAKEFLEKTGVGLAVVDVNDLGKVDVLAISNPKDKERVVESLKTNPQGNANEQTPIALIRA
jgi:hypothetical protein